MYDKIHYKLKKKKEKKKNSKKKKVVYITSLTELSGSNICIVLGNGMCSH